MQNYIAKSRVNGCDYYSVYNSLGQMMLWTSNLALAEFYAAQFRKTPEAVEIIVSDQDPNTPKRR